MTVNGTLKATTFWALFAIVCSVIGTLVAAQSVTSGDVREIEAKTEAHADLEGHPGILGEVKKNSADIRVLANDVKHLTAEVTEAREEQKVNFAEILRRLPAR